MSQGPAGDRVQRNGLIPCLRPYIDVILVRETNSAADVLQSEASHLHLQYIFGAFPSQSGLEGQLHSVTWGQDPRPFLCRPWDLYFENPSGKIVTVVPYLSAICLATVKLAPEDIPTQIPRSPKYCAALFASFVEQHATSSTS